eukprot:TRINITY_DN23241_c0_g1_i1.p1 TRINITY_DN23241_c0_g1~~TRINITY_DN23241_c0_g1_i1.p1  ORF type:complete len:341 (+),score=103.93 TRINITY_DN23241_c0_g1_i1:48-1025(+)
MGFLPCCCGSWCWVLAGLVLFPFIKRFIVKPENIDGKLVVITGGSEGIGKSLAEECLKRGANVIVMARTEAKLKAACEELKKFAKEGRKIAYACVDVTDLEGVRKSVKSVVDEHGAPAILITSAGASYPGYFLEQEPEIFQKTMNLNYMGNVNVIKTAVPAMIANGGGRVMIVASAAGVCSFIGYSTYSPSKYALRGFSDAIRSELNGFNIKVSICYPPDTDTPGFKKENETKPKETLQCFPASPYSPESVARQSMSSLLLGDYHIQSVDILQNILVSTMSGVTPRAFFFLEALLQPIMVFLQMPFYMWFDYQARCYASRVKKQS